MYNHTNKSRLVVKYRIRKAVSHYTVLLNKHDPILDPKALVAGVRGKNISDIELLGISYML